MADRSEIKRNYKENPPDMGIYKITNLESGNIFIGSSKNIRAIMNRHRFELSTGMHRIKELQDAWDKSGESRIEFITLDILEQKEQSTEDLADDLSELEDMWMEKLLSEGINAVRMKNTGIA